MIDLLTYRLKPYTAANARTEPFTTEWLRVAINKEVRDKSEILKSKKADPSYFYNHDPETGKTRIGYPLIIYYYIDGVFYITGINEGAFALEKLAELYRLPFLMREVVFQGFRKEETGGEFELGITRQLRSYALIEWRPIHHTARNAFMQLGMEAKVTELNNSLRRHLTNELGKYLGISLEGLKHEITDITRVYEPSLYKKRHKYPAFDIRFKANVSLPPMITLGNHQSLGYGRVVPQ